MNAQGAFRRLCDVISDSMRKLGIPGAAVGVISDDQEFSAGFGVTNVEHPRGLAAQDDHLLTQDDVFGLESRP